MIQKTRIDKWLWSVRLFKTQTMATDACNAGKVKINNVNCKPSREIKENDEIQIRINQLLKTVKVLDAPKSRISAKLVPDYYLDLTPEEEYDRIKMLKTKFEHRQHGLGRPTKKDRRKLSDAKDGFLSSDDSWDFTD